ncbi:MAG TPA: hypothetical protein VFP60_09560 [Pseudolabrys sp.]|nr:hypothetical protein [Pseudolabrys sp.]
MADERVEPEIIPPEKSQRGEQRTRVFIDGRGTERIYIAQPGSVGSILVVLITGLLLAAFFVLLLSTMLIWLPVLILIGTAVLVIGMVRAFLRGGR